MPDASDKPATMDDPRSPQTTAERTFKFVRPAERRPIPLAPKIEPNLKSATLYPAEKGRGFRIVHEGKKHKERDCM